jgi:hypothetical protein
MYPPLPPSPKIEPTVAPTVAPTVEPTVEPTVTPKVEPPVAPMNGQLIQLIFLTLLDQIQKNKIYRDPRLLNIVDLILEYMD